MIRSGSTRDRWYKERRCVFQCWLLTWTAADCFWLLVVGCRLLALLKTCKFTTTQRNPNQTNFQEEKQKEGRRIILPARKQTKHYYDSLFRNMIVLKHWCEDTINLVYFTYAKHPYVVYKNKNKSNNWRPASMRAQIRRRTNRACFMPSMRISRAYGTSRGDCIPVAS